MTKDPRDLFDASVSEEFKARVMASVAPELERNRKRGGAAGGRRWFLWSSALGSAAAAVAVGIFVKTRKSSMPEEGFEMTAIEPELLEMDEEFLADLELLEGLEEIEGLEEEVDA